MRARLVPVWSLAALIAPASFAPAQPPEAPSVASRILDMKPAPDGADDTPLRKLQKERFNARLRAARVQAQAVQAGTGASAQELAALLATLAENGAEMEAKPADRVKWYELRVDVMKEQERMATDRARAGVLSPAQASLATAARADAEIALLLLKESLKEKK